MVMSSRDRILVVDDEIDNLLLIKQILESDYEIIFATNGEEAIELAVVKPLPALILLDIMMPGMNGYIVMNKLKKIQETSDIPVIFLTAMGETQEETKGFMLGAVDYIVKPIQPSIVKARVRTQLQLHQANRHIQSLYDDTLTGVIELLNDVLIAANPIAYSRASRIRHHMGNIQKKMGLEDYWEFNLAAMLSQIGCVTLDSKILEKIHTGVKLSAEEHNLYRKHPLQGRDLLQKIPYFEKISAIVWNQEKSLKELCGAGLASYDIATGTGVASDAMGGALLKIALTVENLVQEGHSDVEALELVAEQLSDINPKLSELLKQSTKVKKVVKAVEAYQLKPKMILEKDLYSQNGLLLLSRNTPISRTILDRIMAFHRGTGIVTPIFVSIED